MAEGIARKQIGEGLPGVDKGVFMASAGVAAGHGTPATPEALEALARLGIEFIGRSTLLTGEMIRRADVVLCMTGAHSAIARDLVRGDPEALAKIHLLDPEADIEDPIGLDQAAYDRLAHRLAALISPRLQELLQP